MSNPLSEIVLRPIGFVRNGIARRPASFEWKNVISEIELQPDLSDALDNLDEFSHIIVLFWAPRDQHHKVSHKVHPKGSAHLPLVGLLATRSPHRPNPVAKTTVELLERRLNVIKVKGLDAFDGTLIIDIKPYLPGYDSVRKARTPGWAKERRVRP